MPIYNFTECLNKIKDNNNNIGNIFISLIELNNQKYGNEQFTKPINTTIFQFFTENFENEGFLDYSICNNMEVKVSKKVETSKIDYQEIKDIENKYNISIFKNETNFVDYCSPLNINNKDLTVYDRQIILLKNAMPCDDGCSFISFDYTTNYSTCLCKIYNEDEDINLLNEINEKFKGNEYVEKFIQLKEKGNWKYFLCYKQAFRTNKKEKLNWIRYISIVLIITVIIFQILLYIIVKIYFPFDKNKSEREKEIDKNLKNSKISFNKASTISYESENDKSDWKNIDTNYDKILTISYKSEDEKNIDNNYKKTLTISYKDENDKSDEKNIDNNDNKAPTKLNKNNNDKSDEQNRDNNVNKTPTKLNKNNNDKSDEKNIDNNVNKTPTISYKDENDKSDEKNRDNNVNKTPTISYKDENDKSDEQNIDNNVNKTPTISYKDENDKSDEKNIDNNDNKAPTKLNKNENDKSDEQNIDNNVNKTPTISYINENDILYDKDKKKKCNKTIKFDNYISNQDKIGNINDKGKSSENTKKKKNKISNNRYKSPDKINNSEGKEDNDEEKKNNMNKTHNKRSRYPISNNLIISTNRNIKTSIYTSRNENIRTDRESNKSENTKNDKADSMDDYIFKTNNNFLKENHEIDKKEGMGDDIVTKRNIFQNYIFLIFIYLKQELPNICNTIIIFIFSFHNLFFYNAFLFSDKIISRRFNLKHKHEFIYLLSKEYDRILLVFFFCKIIDRIFKFSLKRSKKILYLAKAYENKINYKNEKETFSINIKERNIIKIAIKSSNENESEKKIDLINAYRKRMIIIHILIIIIQLIYLYFFLIFGNVNPNIQLLLLYSSIILFAIYQLCNFIYYVIKDRIKESLIKENNCFLKCLYKLKKEIFK